MQKIPTWLYAANGEAHLFELEPGEAWPDGWLDSPGAWNEVRERGASAAANASLAVNQAVDDLANIIASQDKVALDAFAAKQGIQLDRRKSFGKMVSDYQEAISR